MQQKVVKQEMNDVTAQLSGKVPTLVLLFCSMPK